jgi:23S rRNA pseudouridine1911/1915/1917 synthase
MANITALAVSESQAGQRLDVFVVAAMPRLSRAFVHKLCDTGKISVNGEPAKPGYKVRVHEDVAVDYDLSELDNIPVTELPVIYEDGDAVVVDKPIGMLTHAKGAFEPEATVASFLRTRVVASDEWPDSGRAGVVHRLDRGTSGVLIGAKHKAALSFLQRQFSERKVRKTYIAIVYGHLKQPEAVVDIPIERNPKAPATFKTGPNGKAAVTHYKVIAESKHASMIELAPKTGRTHQLRVHMSHLGHPIVGDPVYGKDPYGTRLYLHALSLEITMLKDHERRTFVAPLPPEFEEYMRHDR